jgi:Transglycosylase-like domain
MRTLAVVLALALPTTIAASVRPHSHDHKTKPDSSSSSACLLGCHIHQERVAVRRVRHRVVKRSLAAYLPRPRSAHLSWRMSQVHRELAWWLRTDRHTRRLARIPLSRRIPRWREWHCIAHFESTSHWAMSPTSDPPSGGEYWGGLQMDSQFMQSYGADMIRRHHGGLADTWTPVEQITVANRAWQTRGFAPWPTTSGECGL